MISSTNYEKSFSFIHASDLHLGSQQFTNSILADDYLNSLKQILERAENLEVDFIIFGGDVFTSRDILPSLFQNIIQLLQEFYNRTKDQIPIIAIEGNHDVRRYSHGQRLTRKGSWLQVLHQLNLIVLLDVDQENFSQEGFVQYESSKKVGSFFRCKDAIIYGTSFHKENVEGFLKDCHRFIPNITDSESFHILLQHFGIEGQMKNVPGVKFTDVQFLQQKIHYLGLGHYHKGFSIGRWVFNPGCPEAVSPIETSFSRGMFFVEVFKSASGYMKKVKRIPLNNRRYCWITINVCESFKNIERFCSYIQRQLINQLNDLRYGFTDDRSNLEAPRLFIVLRGMRPSNFTKIVQKKLSLQLRDNLLVSDVKIYPKFEKSIQCLDRYLGSKSNLFRKGLSPIKE